MSGAPVLAAAAALVALRLDPQLWLTAGVAVALLAVAVAAVAGVVRLVAVGPLDPEVISPRSRSAAGSVLRGRVTDPSHHPLRPRAPGRA